MSYLELADTIVKRALKVGADQSEVYIIKGKEMEIRTAKMKIESIKEARKLGMGLRVIVNKGIGSVFTSNMKQDNIEKLIDESIALAKEASEDEFNLFYKPCSVPKEIDIYDEKIEQIPIEEKVEIVRIMEKTAFESNKMITASNYVSYEDEAREIFIVNSNGLSYSYKEANCGIGGGFIATKEEIKQAGYGMQMSRSFDKLNPQKVGKEAADEACLSLGGKPVKTGKFPVVLKPEACGSFLSGIANAINGKKCMQRNSFLWDKEGQKIGSDIVNIIDDGTNPEWAGTSPVDDEGVIKIKREMIKNGVLQGFLYDLYTASKKGISPTGNAKRPSYAADPMISPNNLFVMPGDKTPEELIGEINEGFYITSTIGFGINPITGDFSVGACGVWIKGGKFTLPVAGVTIASNMKEMLKNIDAIANDIKEVDSGIVSPTIRIKEMTIAGE